MKEQQCSMEVQQPFGTSLSCHQTTRLLNSQKRESDRYRGSVHNIGDLTHEYRKMSMRYPCSILHDGLDIRLKRTASICNLYELHTPTVFALLSLNLLRYICFLSLFYPSAF